MHQTAYHTGHGASQASQGHATTRNSLGKASAAPSTNAAAIRRSNLTSEEIQAREQDYAKDTIAIAKDIKHGMSAASIRTKYNVSDSDIISRLATATKQMHEILDVKGLVSLMSLITNVWIC